MSAIFAKKQARLTCCKGCSNVLQKMLLLNSNLLFLEITFLETTAFQKKTLISTITSHVTYY